MKDLDVFQSYGYTVDVTVREQVWALAAHMRHQVTDVSMVISNAGVLTCAPLAHLRPEAVANIIEVNLMAHFWVSSLNSIFNQLPPDLPNKSTIRLTAIFAKQSCISSRIMRKQQDLHS